ncbi:putative 3 -5 exonuclease protein [Botrytis fragariae]|uniref:Putative 3 -5 exonuclease protein n=1 Tax=Botrytis fragariae TaxID=1964551 RepID=A0A8H6B343_9HELO|nr:putative 3 -5 exonuclease protein [Botrytis fragariae]KAF5878561.1 putative 3 -5 exonuclease protein [Botrytis fragariae]
MSTTWDVVFTEEFDENFGMGLDDECERYSKLYSISDLAELQGWNRNLSDNDNEDTESSSSDSMPSLVPASEEGSDYYTSDYNDEIESKSGTEVDFWAVSQDEGDQMGQESGPLIDWDFENSDEPMEQEPLFKTFMIDTPEIFDEFLPVLSQLMKDIPELGYDCEGGKSFGRNGVLTFFSMSILSRRETYIIDVLALTKLGTQVFEQENAEGLSLKKVLGSKKYLQLWFDVRQDWDTLYHLFGLTPGRILDLQLLEFLSRRGSKDSIMGLFRIIRDHGKAFMSNKAHEDWLDEKEEGRQYFSGHELGYGVLEEERPISETTKRYIAGDSDCMFHLYFHLEVQLRNWVKEMQIRIPEKTTESAEKNTELSDAKQHIEAPFIIESRLSTSKPEESTEISSPVEPRRREDWLTFVEEQSMLRAELAMALEYDPNDEDRKYSAPEAFLEISRQQSDPERAAARLAKEIECSLLI